MLKLFNRYHSFTHGTLGRHLRQFPDAIPKGIDVLSISAPLSLKAWKLAYRNNETISIISHKPTFRLSPTRFKQSVHGILMQATILLECNSLELRMDAAFQNQLYYAHETWMNEQDDYLGQRPCGQPDLRDLYELHKCIFNISVFTNMTTNASFKGL